MVCVSIFLRQMCPQENPNVKCWFCFPFTRTLFARWFYVFAPPLRRSLRRMNVTRRTVVWTSWWHRNQVLHAECQNAKIMRGPQMCFLFVRFLYIESLHISTFVSIVSHGEIRMPMSNDLNQFATHRCLQFSQSVYTPRESWKLFAACFRLETTKVELELAEKAKHREHMIFSKLNTQQGFDCNKLYHFVLFTQI